VAPFNIGRRTIASFLAGLALGAPLLTGAAVSAVLGDTLCPFLLFSSSDFHPVSSLARDGFFCPPSRDYFPVRFSICKWLATLWRMTAAFGSFFRHNSCNVFTSRAKLSLRSAWKERETVMTPATMQLPEASPDNPVRKALDDLETRNGLLDHAVAVLSRRLIHRSYTDRLDKANEACQETYSRALQKIHEYDATRPVQPWLHGIMNNVLFEATRELRRSPAQQPEDATTWERLATDLGTDLARIASGLDVAGFLAKLPPEHKEIVQFRFYDGLTHEDLAARLGITIGNARVRLCRALNALKAIAATAMKDQRP
jgi:RNA polymerase sigma-70 factor (ECF subfamily)